MKKTFELWPAIDIIHGSPVRLLKGDYSQKTEYGEKFSLKSLADEFSSFATGIHVVDLDGAKNATPVNLNAIRDICNSSKIPVEVGGGIRTLQDIESLFNCGASRIILGTSALKNPLFLKESISRFGSQKIVVGVDAKDGYVATHGWEKKSHIQAEDFIQILQDDFHVNTIIFTDIETDGMLSGPPLSMFSHLSETFPKTDIIASGGVSCISDIQDLRQTGVTGSIFGKAFYEEKITTEELHSFRFSC